MGPLNRKKAFLRFYYSFNAVKRKKNPFLLPFGMMVNIDPTLTEVTPEVCHS